MRTAGFRSMYFATLIAFGLPCAGMGDSVSELDDATARIQYAFYAADVRGIEDALVLVRRLELPASRKGMKEYYAAFGHWKLAELYADEAATGQRAARSSMRRTAETCEKEAAAAMKIDSQLAEAHAIQARCAALSSRAPELLSLGSCLRHKGLARARELDGTNPRVRLIEARCMWDEERNRGALLARVQGIVRDFDATPSVSPGRPDWGQPEAYVLLGRLQLEQGNRLAARDSFERALVIAPDYRMARQLLEQATTP